MQTLDTINVGQEPNDGKGEDHRSAFQKVNANFDKVVEGVGQVDSAVQAAAQAAQAAGEVAAAAIPETEKGSADGVAPLDSDGKLPVAHLPAVFIPKDEKGAAGGVAPLDSDGKLPEGYLPAVFIPKDEKGAAGGVATLGTDGKVTPQQLPNAADAIPMSEKGAASGVASLDENSRLVQQHALGVTVAAGTDANSLVLPGQYNVHSDADISVPLNWPVALAGALQVNSTTDGNAQVTQLYTTRPAGGVVRSFVRVRFNGAWSGWVEQVRAADLATLSGQMAQVFGVGQSWQNVAAGRAADINYTNSTGRPILMAVTVQLTGANGRIICYLDNRVAQDAFNPSAGATLGGSILVPANSVGRIVPVQANISSWWEYR